MIDNEQLVTVTVPMVSCDDHILVRPIRRRNRRCRTTSTNDEVQLFTLLKSLFNPLQASMLLGSPCYTASSLSPLCQLLNTLYFTPLVAWVSLSLVSPQFPWYLVNLIGDMGLLVTELLDFLSRNKWFHYISLKTGLIQPQQYLGSPRYNTSSQSIKFQTMPQCYCTSYGCGGKEVHAQTHQTHSCKDVHNASVDAYEASQRALNDQEELTEHISVLTLSNNVSENNPESGGWLWHRSSPPVSIAKESPETTSGCKYLDSNKADHSLCLLRDLENEFQSLSSSLSRIPSIGNPPLQSSLFPLRSDLASAYDIHDRLIGITNKSSVVQELKESLSIRLSSLIITLKEAQDVWTKGAHEIPREEQDRDETVYVTGEVHLPGPFYQLN